MEENTSPLVLVCDIIAEEDLVRAAQGAWKGVDGPQLLTLWAAGGIMLVTRKGHLQRGIIPLGKFRKGKSKRQLPLKAFMTCPGGSFNGRATSASRYPGKEALWPEA